MANVNTCQECFCFCWMVTSSCIVALSELTSSVMIETNHINLTNMEVSDLLGEQCFQELCTALTQAVKDANEHNENPANEDKKCATDFLEPRWVSVVSNMYFKTWYASKVAYYWFEGSSITQLKKVGLITTSNDDKDFKNAFKLAGEAQRKRLASGADINASNAKDKFKKYFWDLQDTQKMYSCRPACPCDKKDNSGTSISMSPLHKKHFK